MAIPNTHLLMTPTKPWVDMMTSSNGNIFRVTGHCAGNSPVPGEFPTQKPVTRIFDVFFDLRLNKRLSKQWWGWWFETPSRPSWLHRNVLWFAQPYLGKHHIDSPHKGPALLSFYQLTQAVAQTAKLPIVWDIMTLRWRLCNTTRCIAKIRLCT